MTYIVVHNPNHDILASQRQSIRGRTEPCSHNGLFARHHLEEFLDLGILVKLFDRESSAPHSTPRRLCAHLTTDQLLALRSHTVGCDDNVCLVSLSVICCASALACCFILKVIDDLAVELDRHAEILHSADKHAIDERAHLEFARRCVRVQALSSQTVGNLLWRNDNLTGVLECLNPGIM